jgi:alkylhydroperoxidase/carboxymuconolactone decarboxylase family protein YurZ
MPRIRRTHAQQRFDLYPDDDLDEKRLHKYLRKLAIAGKQREWIVSALLAALNKENLHEHRG